MKMILTFFLFLSETTLAKTLSCTATAEQLYQQILTNVQFVERADNFVNQENLLRLLMDDKSIEATDRISRLSQIYLGESVGEILSEIITKRGREILPLLKKDRCEESIAQYCGTKSDKRTCVASLKCAGGSGSLVELIKQNQIFQSDEKPLASLTQAEKCTLIKKVLP